MTRLPEMKNLGGPTRLLDILIWVWKLFLAKISTSGQDTIT